MKREKITKLMLSVKDLISISKMLKTDFVENPPRAYYDYI